MFLTDVHKQLGTDSWTKEQLKEFVWNTLNSGKVCVNIANKITTELLALHVVHECIMIMYVFRSSL